MSDLISREHLIGEIEALMQSPWFNDGKEHTHPAIDIAHLQYLVRKEAVETVRDLCVRQESSVTPDAVSREVIEDIKKEIYKLSDHVQVDHHTEEYTNWIGMKKKVLDIIDKHISRKEKE